MKPDTPLFFVICFCGPDGAQHSIAFPLIEQ